MRNAVRATSKPRWPAPVAVAILAAAAWASSARLVVAAELVVIDAGDPGAVVVELRGLTSAPRAAIAAALQQKPRVATAPLLAVRLVGAPASVAMFGRLELTSNGLRFTPRYPLSAGAAYVARFDPAGWPTVAATGLPVLEQRFELSRPAAATTEPPRLAAIYPSADALPENLLKFYFEFSAPMARGEAYRRLLLREAGGRVIDDAFLELGEELWNRAGTRLTVLFDPGRIKRGLKPHEDVGRPLKAGRRYELRVAAGWRAADGGVLQEAVVKRFAVTPLDDRQPDVAQWRLSAPPAGERRPLIVAFDEPLDRALAKRTLQVVDGSGTAVAGEGTVAPGEESWQFLPAQPWRAGKYELVAGHELEDLAGNSLGRPFETASGEGPTGATRAEFRREFACR